MKKSVLLFLLISSLSFSQSLDKKNEKISINDYKFLEMYLNIMSLKNITIPEFSDNYYYNGVLLKSQFEIQKGFEVYIDKKENRLSVKKYLDSVLVYSTDSYIINNKLYTMELVNSSKINVSLLKDSYYEYTDKIKK